MLPPSDSLRHQSHKLAEALTNLQNGVTAPPPPYAPAPDETLANVDAEDEPRPIAIHVDASINIRGYGNTVILPSVPGQQQPPTSTPTAAPDRNTGILQVAQKQRQAKLTELATAIIAALRDSDHLPHRERGSRVPVEISVDAGVKVEGSRNFICAGAGVPGRFLHGGKNGMNGPGGGQQNTGRKRRAQSVCAILSGCSSPYVF